MAAGSITLVSYHLQVKGSSGSKRHVPLKIVGCGAERMIGRLLLIAIDKLSRLAEALAFSGAVTIRPADRSQALANARRRPS